MAPYVCKSCGSTEAIQKWSRGRCYSTCRRCALKRTERWRKSSNGLVYMLRKSRSWYARTRSRVISELGGACACCGESEKLFLEVDHIHNDGYAERKGNLLYRRVLAAGCPRDRYQVLCSNCNQGKRRNAGVCPHLSAPKSASEIRYEFIGRLDKVTA